MPRPYTSAAQYTAEAKSIGFMSCLKESGGMFILCLDRFDGYAISI